MNRAITTLLNIKICEALELISQFYIQLVFKAPLCITLTISDQKIVSGSLFLNHNFFSKYQKTKKNILFYVTFQCGRQGIFKIILKFLFDLENIKKPPQKVAYLSRNSVVSEIFHLLPTCCPTAQMAEVMFQNVVYRATVYRTGKIT